MTILATLAFSSSWWQRIGAPIGNHLWQSTLFAGVAGATDPPAEKEPRRDAVLALANRVGEIFTALLLADCNGKPYPMVESTNNLTNIHLCCDTSDQRAFCRSESKSGCRASFRLEASSIAAVPANPAADGVV
jgi:hypothetical protein